MKIWKAVRESLRVYAHNFADLMLAYLVQVLVRCMCLTPLLFLLTEEMKGLAWLCVPLFVLLVLPARQNYALAMQDMLHGGSVFSARLISAENYFFKLWRGVIGLMKAAVWLALPVLAVMVMYEIYMGEGDLSAQVMSLWGITERDGISAMRWFRMFGSDTIDGLKNILLIVAGLFMLPVIGCMVHCGARHAVALEDRKLLRGQRLKLWVIWVLSLTVFVPFVLVTGVTLGSNLKLFISGFAEMFLSKSFSIPEMGERLYLIAGAFVLLFIPMVPLKQLMPAVAVHQQMLSQCEEIKTDVEA